MGRPAKVLLITLAVVVGVYLLFTVVFPWVDATFVTDPVLEGRGSGGGSAPGRPGAATVIRAG